MGEFNVNKTDGSLEQTAGMPSEYPATQVMLSDGETSVEEALDDRVVGIHISSPVNGVSVGTAWGSWYSATISVDISSLGLTNVPTILSMVFNNSTSWTACAMVGAITKSNVDIILFRPSTGAVTGTIELIIQDND
jgi:hypothetical protein